MPVAVRRSTILNEDAPLDNPGVRAPPEENGFWGNLVDTYATGMWGAFKDEIEENLYDRVPGYDGLDNIPQGYEQFAEEYMYAGSPEQVAQITLNIDDMLQRKERLAQNGFGENLFYGLVAGIFDPVNLIAGPSLKGVSFLRGAMLGGVSYGSINAVQEVARARWDPTVSPEETVMSVGFGYAAAGLISGGIAHFSRGARRTGTAALPRNVRAQAEEAGDLFGRAIAMSEGRPVTERIDFRGQGVKIVDGPTGKVDREGNPAMAFFRSREEIDAEARAERVSRAADSALGDIIPESAADEGVAIDGVPPGVADELDELAEGAVRTGDETAEGAEEAALPFGPEGEQGRAPRGGEPEDTIFVDSDAVMAAYERKVWTSPRTPGVEPLAEDAFGSVEEWFNFVVRHELHHKTTRRNEGESRADYENRINRLALEETQADRLAQSPTDGALEKLMLLPTPSGTLMRLAPRHRETHQLAQGVAGDHSTMTIANQAGLPNAPGGSVYQLSLRWQQMHYRAKVAAARAYALYVRGHASPSPSGASFQAFTAGLPRIGAAARQGKLTRAQFNDYVGRAVHDDEAFELHGHPLSDEDMALVRAAANEGRAALAAFEADARALGMFDAQRRLGDEIAWRREANARDEAILRELRSSGVAGERADLLGSLYTVNGWLFEGLHALEDILRRARWGTAEYSTELRTALTHEKVRSRMSPEQAALADRLLLLIDEGVPVRVGNPGLKGDGGTVGLATFFNTGEPPKVRLRNLRSKSGIKTLLHEAAHVAFISKYGFYFTKMDTASEFAVRLRGELADVMLEAEKRTGSGMFYGMSNPDEFVAEALTSPAFQKWLKGEQLWQKVVDFVRQVIGLEPKHTDLLSDALDILDELVTEGEGMVPLHERAAGDYGLDRLEPRASRRGGRRAQGEEPPRRGRSPFDELDAEIRARAAEIEEMEAELAALSAEPIVPPKETHYFPRLFDIAKIRARYDDFVALVAESYGATPEAFTRARETADRIIGEGGDEQVFGLGSPKHLKGRQIPLSNKDLSDFIVQDIDLVMGIYTRRMGAAIEMTRKYGSTHLGKELSQLRAQLRKDGYAPDRIRKITEEIEDMRDRVLGRFHSSDPLSWSNRAARTIKQFGNLTLLGKGIAAQLVDVARTVAGHGYKPLFQALEAVWSKDFEMLAKGRYAKAAGEGFDIVQARAAAMMVENDSALMVTRQTGFERGLAQMQPAFFIANLMSPFTVAWKDFTSLMSGHMLIDESVTIANAIRSGKTVATLSPKEQKTLARLASYGIDVRKAQLIADMPLERSPGGNLWLANLGAWEGTAGEAAREAFLGALSGSLRTNVVTPGPLQRAAIMDGVFRWKGKRVEAPLLSIPFQLMSFGMAGSAKITHAMLSGRDRNRMVTLMSLLAGGYVSARLSALIGGNDWDILEPEEKIYRSIDRSGIGGYLTDAARRIEDLTGYGPETAITGDNFGSDRVSTKIGAVAGPAPSVLAGAIEAFVSNNPELDEKARAGMVRRAVPWTGLIWLDEGLKDLTDIFLDMSEGDPDELPVALDEQ